MGASGFRRARLFFVLSSQMFHSVSRNIDWRFQSSYLRYSNNEIIGDERTCADWPLH